MSLSCPFCQPNITAPILWENEYYRISPDEYPRCTGHLLVITKSHQQNHMDIPSQRLPLFEDAIYQAYRFLSNIFCKASFLENGETYQEVSHAHLHCLPFAFSLPEVWVERDIVHQITNREELWFECKKVKNYFYTYTATGGVILSQDSKYKTLLGEIQTQITRQTNAQIDRSTGDLLRGGPELVTETVQLWREWFQKTSTDLTQHKNQF